MIGRREITITDLVPSTPWRNIPVLKGRAAKTFKNSRRLIKTNIRKARRATIAYTRKQYFVSSAYKDLKTSIRQNEDIFIAAVATFALVSYALAALIARFVVSIFTVTYEFSESVSVDPALPIVVMGALIGITSMLMAAFSMNFVSFSLMDGINRKQYKSIRSTARRSLKLSGRIALAWSFFGAMILARIFLMLIIGGIYAKWIYSIYALPVNGLIFCGILGSAWLLEGIFKYSLVPTVALYERDLLLIETFERSNNLTKKGSKVFLLAGSLSISAYAAGIYFARQYLDQWLDAAATLLFIVGILIGVLIINSALALLYRKRKLART